MRLRLRVVFGEWKMSDRNRQNQWENSLIAERRRKLKRLRKNGNASQTTSDERQRLSGFMLNMKILQRRIDIDIFEYAVSGRLIRDRGSFY